LCLQSNHSDTKSDNVTVSKSESQLPNINNQVNGNIDDSKTLSADKAVIDKIQNGSTDIDSGIDTSDSCDEKKYKKQAQVKVVRRQHSRSFACVKLGDFNSI